MGAASLGGRVCPGSLAGVLPPRLLTYLACATGSSRNAKQGNLCSGPRPRECFLEKPKANVNVSILLANVKSHEGEIE